DITDDGRYIEVTSTGARDPPADKDVRHVHRDLDGLARLRHKSRRADIQPFSLCEDRVVEMTRPTTGERDAAVYRQVRQPDQRSAERLLPSGVPRFIETAELWVVGRLVEGFCVDGHGAIPPAEQDFVQGLLPACKGIEPAFEGLLCKTVRGAGLADSRRAQSLRR